MKICNVDRNIFYKVLAAAFSGMKVAPDIAELGVLRGDNAMEMYKKISPRHMFLIDGWSKSINETYSPFEQLPKWVSPIESFGPYFGGPMDQQLTFDALHKQCVDKFAKFPNVTIIRADTLDAIPEISKHSEFEMLDLVYVDANHQYEYVLRDLMYYEELVKQEGVLMLNDCCHSESGMRQNLGVLEAVTHFIKRTDFIPVAMTHTDWSDVILVRNNSRIKGVIHELILNSNISYVEVPYQMISAAKVVAGAQRLNISFV